MPRIFLAFAAFLFSLLPIWSQTSLPPDDPSAWLGFGIGEAFAACGPPATVAALRGPEAWQDDVVFAYPQGFSLYWSGDHLWQIGFSSRYGASVFGIFAGDGTDKMLSLLGQPWRSREDSLVWRLPWKGYPVQLRVTLRDGKADGIFVLRSDY
jgi:hypothetical protein